MSGWVTSAKPSRRSTDPGVSHTFSRRFSKQNYTKYISDVVSKILEKKAPIIRCFVWIIYFWNWVSSGERWKSLLPIFPMFHWTDFGGFLVCCYGSHPTIKWRWKKFCCNYFDAKPQFDWTIGPLIFRTLFCSCEKHRPLLWLARTYLDMKIYDKARLCVYL